MSVDGPRQNFHKEIEAGINKQINLELYSSYFYLGLAYHFDRDDIALSGFHKYFKKLSDEERCDAEKVAILSRMLIFMYSFSVSRISPQTSARAYGCSHVHMSITNLSPDLDLGCVTNGSDKK